jgi:hypothetical protein
VCLATALAMPAGPDADGLRHQLKRIPAWQIAVGINERSQHAVTVDGDPADGLFVRHVSYRFQQQHGRIVRQISARR